MAKYIVEPVKKLRGEIRVDGAKNGVLPLMAAALLTDEMCEIHDVPNLRDVGVMSEVLRSLGAEVNRNGSSMQITTPKITSNEAPYEYVSQMRSSFDVMGPLLARTGLARVPMPGGCAIGERPIDLHIKGFKALGAEVSFGHGFVEAKAKKLVGASIYLDFPSVGATKNIMMAATLAEGVTHIENAAKEPEIVDIANFLNKLGAKVQGAGTDTIRITGVDVLKGAAHTVLPDRIEAGTYLIMAGMLDSDLKINNIEPSHLKPVIAKLRECGVTLEEDEDCIYVKSSGKLKAVDITTLPYPGFPTDLQAQFMALLTRAEGSSVVMETVFENRFMHVSELNRMGANIKIEGHSAILSGDCNLQGAQVKATDLRAGAALIMAGLVAEGNTEIHDIYHIDRGYNDLVNKLRGIGIKITRVEE
ncbi:MULTISPECIES: UDP-N-acetylglucosamine 1-carboxyvinyltransferase [unclassified Fusibacter]|uniref:UDP-N-acetylglucosamine 1-carboxyvinyltransferase n=1 Tax=unclassified Fusibacter TaxID=2624464 RepID=UPI0010130CCF|nr:UDP-N-acetylglucosamine 1-carboxyvinyltransferase [Fusibacter sp. A1]MCK8059856.1 UDP-N-acetylglucosamine 1-carboxyvinyltransferase [Fusibacter sp. A2]NPE21658.1 UDP-N-acetylglucosamine 1-carboxyvinyltransferase [Fusibacter sp. A1]RXV62062.1 UDP-N-acetylglucosamine 1-carboxyvinyltransferase [Fusibacter sp. A1]